MSGETINAIRVAASEQRPIPAVRRELAQDPALEPICTGSDTYRWRESARHTMLSRSAQRQGLTVKQLLDRMVLSGLRSLRGHGDGAVRAQDIALSKGLRVEEAEGALARLEERGEVHYGSCTLYRTRGEDGRPVVTWGWKLGTPELTVTVGEALGVTE